MNKQGQSPRRQWGIDMSTKTQQIILTRAGCVALSLAGGVIAIIAAVWIEPQWKADLDKNLGPSIEFITVEQEALVLDGPAIKNTISDPNERHKYEFSGKAEQNIEILIHPLSNVYMAGMVLTEGYKTAIARASVDGNGGNLGDDLIMVMNLPDAKAYQLVVDMVGSYTGDYEIRISTLPE